LVHAESTADHDDAELAPAILRLQPFRIGKFGKRKICKNILEQGLENMTLRRGQMFLSLNRTDWVV
jgi:hypothetical protein